MSWCDIFNMRADFILQMHPSCMHLHMASCFLDERQTTTVCFLTGWIAFQNQHLLDVFTCIFCYLDYTAYGQILF